MNIDINSIKNTKLNKPSLGPSFAGFQHQKSESGDNEYAFNFPHDSAKYEAILEVFSVEKDEKGNYSLLDQKKDNKLNKFGVPLKDGGVVVNLENDYGIGKNEPFAYRFRLVQKGGPDLIGIDAGTEIGDAANGTNANLVSQRGAKINRGGAMLLVIPDSYNVGWVYDEKGRPVEDKELKEKAKNAIKTFSNKLGGTLAGLEQKIPELKKIGYSRIVSTPMFTDDSISSHGYWVKNAMQMSQSLGSINNYTSLQKKMFKSGINLVADGAFVNEGLEGIHFKDVLKWGEKSPYYDWFRAEGIQNGPLSMGVFAKNKENIGHKIVNSPDLYEQDKESGQIKVIKNGNKNYDSKRPTYVQIFDKRLASTDQKNDTQHLIKEYANKNASNEMEINTHDDTVINYSFEIDHEIYNKNIKDLSKINDQMKSGKKILLGDPLAAKILTKSDTYELGDKAAGGFETWDANTDIAKLRFFASEADEKLMKNLSPSEMELKKEEMEQKNCEVQDYAIAAGKYWTKKTNDILLETAAQELRHVGNDPAKAYDEILGLCEGGKLPKSLMKNITPTVVENVFDGSYHLKKKPSSNSKDLLLKGLMDLPLDSIEFGDGIASVLGYPYITNRATSKETLGSSRYSLYKKENPHLIDKYSKVYKQTENMYVNQLSTFADDVMNQVNSKMADNNKLFNGDKATELGKYVLPLVGQDIAKFAIIKALDPKATVKVKQSGEIVYNYDELKHLSLRKVGVIGSNPEDEAGELISKIKHGINRISDEDKAKIVNSVYDRIKHTNAKGFMLSEMILDRTQAGLDWRIDAAKDIVDMGALRGRDSYFETSWNKVIDFWKPFAEKVHKENPNSYFAAEVTDEHQLHGPTGRLGRYGSPEDAVAKFVRETGMTTTANYGYFFSDLSGIFGKSFDKGGSSDDAGARNEKIHNILITEKKYLKTAQMESLLYSYNAVGNHDKPRALHCLGMDMGLFYTDFKASGNNAYRKTAASILLGKEPNELSHDDVNRIDFDTASNKAVAMGDLVRGSMGKALNDNLPEDERDVVYRAVSKAVADLAKGDYMGTEFSADAFGVKPFDKIIDMVKKQMEYNGFELTPKEEDVLINKTFEVMVKPAMSKLEGLMGFLVALPGNPTLFAGDELGLTGYDTECKNVYLQNRAFLNWDLLSNDNKKFITDFKEKVDASMKLRKNPKLKALNTGAPYALVNQPTKQGSSVSAILRQDADGTMAISLFNATGTHMEHHSELGKSYVNLDQISLHSPSHNEGLMGGLTNGKIFYNYNQAPDDNSIYRVCKDGDSYSIKRFKDGERQDIYFNDPTMILYSKSDKEEVPQSNKNEPTFGGRKVLYNPQYNFVSNPYKKTEAAQVGAKLFAQSAS